MAASKVAIECKVTFEKFLQSSPKALAKIEQIDFWDIKQFFPKSEQELQIFKRALSQCTALNIICFADCKLYELSVADFRALGTLLLQCSKLTFLDVRRTVYPLLLHPEPDNVERFYAFCDALGVCENLTWLFFNGNFCKENINEECIQYFINILRKFKKPFNMQYGVNDFEMEHKVAISDVISIDYDSDEDPEESEGHDATSSVVLSFDKKNEAENGFLKRRPEQVKVEELHEGVFLLSKVARYTIESEIKTQRRLKERAAYITIEDSAENTVVSHKKKVYVNPQYEAFLESANARLGAGMFGEAFVIQNVLTGRWHCKKKLERGALSDREVEVLAREGRALSSESLSDRDILISELIHGKNLKTIMKEIAQKKLSFFEEARARNADLEEVYKSQFSEIFSFEQALALNISLVEAYESLHSKGYVHGDIKPDNVMLNHQKKCVAIDFGGTKKAGEVSRWGGAFAYAAPEAFSLAATFKHDIYSMGMVAGRILALAIDNVDLHVREVRFNYYKKLSLDTQGVTQERYNYLKETFKSRYPEQPEIKTFINVYSEVFPVIFGARDREYQEQKKLSAEAVTFCCLIYQMTEPLQERPEINTVLEVMRKIRLEHLKKRMPHFMLALGNDYNNILNELYSRSGKLSNAIHALDDLYFFVLRAVDSNEKNRPSIVELKQYLEKLDNMLLLKTNQCAEIQRRFLEKENVMPEPECRTHVPEIQDSFLDKENVYPLFLFKRSLANKNKFIVPQGLSLLPAKKRNEKRLENVERGQRKKKTLLLPVQKFNKKRFRKVEDDGQGLKQTRITSWFLSV